MVKEKTLNAVSRNRETGYHGNERHVTTSPMLGSTNHILTGSIVSKDSPYFHSFFVRKFQTTTEIYLKYIRALKRSFILRCVYLKKHISNIEGDTTRENNARFVQQINLMFLHKYRFHLTHYLVQHKIAFTVPLFLQLIR